MKKNRGMITVFMTPAVVMFVLVFLYPIIRTILMSFFKIEGITDPMLSLIHICFLPGDEQEKISPLMRPVIDNLEQLIDSNEEKRYEDEAELKGKVDEIFDRGLIQTEALNYIRGRSIVKTYLIIDEAQNMTCLLYTSRCV